MNTTKLNRFQVSFDNSTEFHQLKREIFGSHGYYFETEKRTPVIIDVGAHIGLSTLYFKQIYPQAHIKAIEPLKENYQLLAENVFQNNLQDVEIFNVALAESTGETVFFLDSTEDHWFSTAGIHQGAWTGTQTSRAITVPTKTLSEFIDQPVDLLKMDIEGAEIGVLRAAKNELKQVVEIMVEFHPVPNQQLEDLVTLLQELGFKTRLEKRGKIVHLEEVGGLVLVKGRRQ